MINLLVSNQIPDTLFIQITALMASRVFSIMNCYFKIYDVLKHLQANVEGGQCSLSIVTMHSAQSQSEYFLVSESVTL